jgi:plasmid stabilization system protein ParE
MAGRVELSWTTDAKAELQALYTKIAHHDKPAAKRLVSKLRELARGIQDHPEIGRVVPEYGVKNVRERIHGNCRLIYQLSHRGAEIIAIWHSAQLHDDTP